MNEAQTLNPLATMQNDFLSKDEVELLKRTLLKQFAEDEQTTFVRLCQRTRLDPFTKQIYATRRYTKVRDSDTGDTRKIPTLVPVTGIMGLCAVAERTGQYDGCEIFWAGPNGEWKTEWLGDEYPAAAKAIVYHKARKHPEVAIARWGSFVGQTYNYQTKQWEVGDFWARMPDFMIAKVAKAAALRGAFPDQLSNVYIREELEGNITDSEEIPTDEQKVAANQRRAAEIVAHPPSGVTIVPQTGAPPPTPAEALEPAFPEDKPPEKPVHGFAAQLQKDFPQEIAAAAQPKAQETPPEQPDELDMGDEPPPPAATAATPPAPWRDHVIAGIKNPRFNGRKLGELNEIERNALETKWLPEVQAKWDKATPAQRADYPMVEAMIAYYKLANPVSTS